MEGKKGQNITLKIAGRTLKTQADSPAAEQNMRIAANKINAQLDTYANYDMPDIDKLAFVTLTFAREAIRLSKKASGLESAVDGISNELKSYLEGIDR